MALRVRRLSHQFRQTSTATINNPATKPHTGRGHFAVLRRAKSIKKAGENERDFVLEDAERLENICAFAVFMGVGVEVAIVLASFWSLLSPLCEKLAYLLADIAIALGVYGEMRFGGAVGAVLKVRLAGALSEATYLRKPRRAISFCGAGQGRLCVTLRTQGSSNFPYNSARLVLWLFRLGSGPAGRHEIWLSALFHHIVRVVCIDEFDSPNLGVQARAPLARTPILQ